MGLLTVCDWSLISILIGRFRSVGFLCDSTISVVVVWLFVRLFPSTCVIVYILSDNEM